MLLLLITQRKKLNLLRRHVAKRIPNEDGSNPGEPPAEVVWLDEDFLADEYDDTPSSLTPEQVQTWHQILEALFRKVGDK